MFTSSPLLLKSENRGMSKCNTHERQKWSHLFWKECCGFSLQKFHLGSLVWVRINYVDVKISQETLQWFDKKVFYVFHKEHMFGLLLLWSPHWVWAEGSGAVFLKQTRSAITRLKFHEGKTNELWCLLGWWLMIALAKKTKMFFNLESGHPEPSKDPFMF